MKQSSQQPPANYQWWVMAIVMIGTMMAALDTSIVNVSIPAIMADFGSNVDDIEWVVTGYMIAFATLMPLTAWLRDRIGYRILFVTSLFVFTFGSVLCGAAWDVPSLVTARVIQALGGGAISPTGMAMITEVFDKSERGRAIGIWGMGLLVGPVIGPTAGGFLTMTFGWRSIFLVNLPFGIIAILLAMNVLMRDRPHKSSHRPFDYWGFIFLSVFLISFLLGLSKGEKEGWTSAFILTCAALSIFSFIGFLLVESLVSYRIIDIKLYLSPVFSICSVITVVRSVAVFGSLFILPLFMQQQMGFDAMQTGLIMLPGSIVLMLVMPIVGHFSDRYGPRLPTIMGLIALATFMFLYRNLDVNMSVWNIIMPTIVRGLGMGLLMAPILASAVNAVPTHKAGMASSMLNITMQVGGALGIAVLATVLNHRIHFHLDVVGSGAYSLSTIGQEVFRGLFEHAHNLGYSLADARLAGNILLSKKLAQSGIVMAFQDAFLVGAGIVITALVFAFFLPDKTRGKTIKRIKEKDTIKGIAGME
jgi:DHA2 family multidrug resistance protein